MGEKRDLWVFAYGSLMWKPDFPHIAAESAMLYGYHRDFCIRSIVHRGTVEKPGLVLGLTRGGSCRGIAFRVASHDVMAALAILDAREMVTNVYVPKLLPVHLTTTKVFARCYVSDTRHRQYAGQMDMDQQADAIRHAHGQSGANIDYLARTLAHLKDMEIEDKRLFALGRNLGLDLP